MGTDLRKAVLDGFPSHRAVGVDLFHEFLDLGHQLWQDVSSCSIKFIPGDVFTLPAAAPIPTTVDFDLSKISKLADLIGSVKYLFTGSVFHLFDEAKQAEMARKLVSLLARGSRPGSVIFGRHMGLEEKGEVISSRV